MPRHILLNILRVFRYETGGEVHSDPCVMRTTALGPHNDVTTGAGADVDAGVGSGASASASASASAGAGAGVGVDVDASVVSAVCECGCGLVKATGYEVG